MAGRGHAAAHQRLAEAGASICHDVASRELPAVGGQQGARDTDARRSEELP